MNIVLKTGKENLILLDPVAPPCPVEDPGDACHRRERVKCWTNFTS